MRINSIGYPDPDSDFLLPPGEYLCKVANITSGLHTKNNEDRWNVTLEIVEGQYHGKNIYDNWIFNSNNPHTQRRQVLIQHRVCGLVKDFDDELYPEDVLGRKVIVVVEQVEYNGTVRNKVAFSGYKSEEARPDIDEAAIPF